MAQDSEAAGRSPRTHIDSQPLPTDSMVTVPLSDTGTEEGHAAEEDEEEAAMKTPQRPQISLEERRLSSRPTSAEILQAIREPRDSDSSINTPAGNSPTISLPVEEEPQSPESPSRTRSESSGSDHSAHVDWAELEKKEEQEQESQEDGQDEVSSSPTHSDLSNRIYRPWPYFLLV